jgi:LysR family hydrogen peroxide-inducible transcriptional activator
VLEQTSTIKDMATAGKDQLRSPLQVGAIFTIGPYLFPHFIPQLIKRAPDMPLYVEEGFTATLRQRLRNGELDVIIVALPFTEADVVTQTLYDEPFVVLVNRGHPLADHEAIEAHELERHNVLLLGEGHCFRDQVFEACPTLRPGNDRDQYRGNIRTAAEGSSLETLRHMVASGLGITVLPASAATSPFYNDNNLLVKPFAGQAPTRTVALAWRASFPRHKAVDVLRNAINQCQLDLTT